MKLAVGESLMTGNGNVRFGMGDSGLNCLFVLVPLRRKKSRNKRRSCNLACSQKKMSFLSLQSSELCHGWMHLFTLALQKV